MPGRGCHNRPALGAPQKGVVQARQGGLWGAPVAEQGRRGIPLVPVHLLPAQLLQQGGGQPGLHEGGGVNSKPHTVLVCMENHWRVRI